MPIGFDGDLFGVLGGGIEDVLEVQVEDEVVPNSGFVTYGTSPGRCLFLKLEIGCCVEALVVVAADSSTRRSYSCEAEWAFE